MKFALLIARLLLGLIFVIFGSNAFLHFIPLGEEPAGLAGGFMAALAGTPYFHFVAFIMIVTGVLFLINRFVPLALALLGPVVVNIVLYHAFLHPAGYQPAALSTLLWLLVFYANRSAFAGIFQVRS
jgi:putative oxidoreductase